MKQYTNCDRCNSKVTENTHTIGDEKLCKDCFDKTCGACGRHIPEPTQQYDIGPSIGPGTTCSVCTARYVQWLCNRCGSEIKEDSERVEIHHETKYDGTYCQSCGDKVEPKALEAAESAEPEAGSPDDPPF